MNGVSDRLQIDETSRTACQKQNRPETWDMCNPSGVLTPPPPFPPPSFHLRLELNPFVSEYFLLTEYFRHFHTLHIWCNMCLVEFHQ